MKHNYYLLILLITVTYYNMPVIIHAENSDEWRKKAFNWVYKSQLWKGKGNNSHIPLSGPGSTLQSTGALRELLPAILRVINAKTILDAGCGDFTWMQETPLPVNQYIGVDIVESVIQENKNKYENNNNLWSFMCLDIVKDPIPTVDVILCRDCLAHLSFEDIIKAIRNFKKSGSKYLLASTFPWIKANIKDIKSGNFRVVNLRAYPFNFPIPIMLFQEITAERDMKKAGKYIALWKLEDIDI